MYDKRSSILSIKITCFVYKDYLFCQCLKNIWAEFLCVLFGQDGHEVMEVASGDETTPKSKKKRINRGSEEMPTEGEIYHRSQRKSPFISWPRDLKPL